jgi:branched-chain amino acid transport system ATP-binding protein
VTLAVCGLSCAYDMGVVLDGVDLSVGDGEIVALLGRNGMGKTSLVRSILGLRPPRVTGGSITYRGDDITNLASYAIARRGVGLVPQGRRVFGSLSVAENLVVTSRGQRRPGSWSTGLVYDLFPRLAERRGHLASNLSGGEQQMLAIGRALMTNPRLLVMDEASEGLAPSVLLELGERLHRLRGAQLSVLLVEQNTTLAASLADRIYVLGGVGRVVWEGSADSFRDDDAGAHAHLGLGAGAVG